MDNLEKYSLSSSIDENINLIKEIFKDDDTLRLRRFQNQHNPEINCCILFIEGMADSNTIKESIIKPVINNTIDCPSINLIDYLANQVIISSQNIKITDILTIVNGIIDGDTVMFLQGFPAAILISTKGFKTRSVEEPNVERVIRGPREGFTESLMINLSLIRRKVYMLQDWEFPFLLSLNLLYFWLFLKYFVRQVPVYHPILGKP